ncbi:Long-chain-fatty-acid--CoA ligase [subsurface metagenome]
MNVGRLIKDNVSDFGEYPLLTFEDKEYSNIEIDHWSNKVGNALKSLGVKKGDRVVIQLPNRPEVVVSSVGIFKIGAVVIPLSFLYSAEETAYIYQDSGPVVIISATEFMEKVSRGKAAAPSIKHVISVDEVPDTLLFKDIVDKSSDKLEMEDTADDELAALLYTAGTTGRPKGVMLAHQALYANAEGQSEILKGPLMHGDRLLSSLPLSHSYGMATMNALFYGGMRWVLVRWFDTDLIFEAIQRHKVKITTQVPTMFVYQNMYPEPKKYDLSSIKYWISGSAPLNEETRKEFESKYPGKVYQGWGLTEAMANNSCCPFDRPYKPGSIGRPLNGKMRVVDEDGKPLQVGEVGEIVVGGSVVMQGYWNKLEETKEALQGGWLRTGDMGYMDEDGYYFIVERKKNMIIKAGENIFPREIEEVIYQNPKVSEAAVVGVADQKYGEELKAFIVLKPGEKATEQEIIDFCGGKLTSFKTPKYAQFLDSLPKNPVGKILYKDLRKMG